MDVEFYPVLFLHLLRWSYGFCFVYWHGEDWLIDFWILNQVFFSGINTTLLWYMYIYMCVSVSQSVQSLSRVRLFATPWITVCQASLSITNSRSSLKLTSIESVMPSSHLILCHPLLLLPPIPPTIRVFSSESTLHMRWPKYWSFSFSIIPSKEKWHICNIFIKCWVWFNGVFLRFCIYVHERYWSIVWFSYNTCLVLKWGWCWLHMMNWKVFPSQQFFSKNLYKVGIISL